MKTSRLMICGFSLSVAIAVAASGCLGPRSQATLEEISGSLNSSPFVEAYLEYGAPQEKWSGPSAFMLHVDAKDATVAVVTVTPSMFEKKKPEAVMSTRTPASVTQVGQAGMTTNVARDHLSELATQLQDSSQAFSGCLNPIRVRLIRQDGSLIEKQGCRDMGWARSASEKTNVFLSAYMTQ